MAKVDPCSVMVINGSQEMLELFAELFEEFGEGRFLCSLRALIEPSHVEAIRHLRPQLILIDQPFNDPGMQGWELVQKIRMAHDLRDIPIIFMSTNISLVRDLEAKLAVLDVRTLLKPFDPDSLMLQVRDALNLKDEIQIPGDAKGIQP